MGKINELFNESRARFYNELAAALRTEKTYIEIAKEYGTSVPMVIRVAKLYNLTRPRGKKAAIPKLSDLQKRAERMSKGRCAVHGLRLQGSEPTDSEQTEILLCCPRRDCDRKYRTFPGCETAVVPYEGSK